MRTLTVNEVEEVSGGIVWWAVAAYLAPKVATAAVWTAGAVTGAALIGGAYLATQD
jgi:lactobin A/cerein 7B family class IIb bacteriocin